MIPKAFCCVLNAKLCKSRSVKYGTIDRRNHGKVAERNRCGKCSVADVAICSSAIR